MTNKIILSDEQIGKALHDAGILDLECVALRYDLDIARATEQAVLQSPEIQQLRKDAERYRWLRRAGVITDFSKASIHWKHDERLDFFIDATMEVKP